MQTIRRTTSRRYPLLLRAEHEDAGPYFLVDLAGYGVSWRKPAVENIPTQPEPGAYRSPYAGGRHIRRTTWIPIFYRARLAFTLVEWFPELSAKDAKKIADGAWNRMGDDRTRATPEEVERYAFAMARDALERASSGVGRDAGFSRSDLYRRMDDASLAKVRSREGKLRVELADMRRQRDEALEASRASCRARRVQLRDGCRQDQTDIRDRVRWAAALAAGTLREGRQSLLQTKMLPKRAPRRAGAVRERREESDDAVRANIPRHLLPYFERVKRGIKGSPRMSRTEEFLHLVHENEGSGDEWASLEDESDRKLREMLAKHGAVPPQRRRRSA